MTRSLITGGSAGIGAAFAGALAARGDDLVLVARDAERLERQAEQLRSVYGVQVDVLAADLAVRDDVLRVAAVLSDTDRPVDVLISNAGFGLNSKLIDEDLTAQERGLDIMCRAVLLLGGAAGRAMRARGRGTIINVSSVAGFATLGGYSAIKAYVTAYSESLAVELHGSGVRVMALCPGFVRTEFHPRADIDMSAMPDVGWIDIDDLVTKALRDVERGRVVSVPTVRYKLLAGLARHAPRPVVRAISGRIAEARRS
jgi:short-subunit dehydrogenase